MKRSSHLANRRSRKALAALLVTVAGAGATPLHQAEEREHEELAHIDARPLDRAQFTALLRALHGKELLRELLTLRILEQAARSHGIEIPAEQIRSQVEGWVDALIRTRYRGDRKVYAAKLKESGRSIETILRTRFQQELSGRLQELLCRDLRTIDERAIRAAWEKRYGRGGRQVVVRHILITPQTYLQEALRESAGKTPIDRQACERKAARTIAALRARIAGGEDFAAVAAANTHDLQSAPAGGLLVKYRYRRFGEEFARQVCASARGELSPVFKSRFGYHILRVEEEDITPLAKVHDTLAEELRSATPNWQERAAIFKEIFESARPRLFGEDLRGDGPQDPVARFAGGAIQRHELDEFMVCRYGLSDVRTIAQLWMLRAEAQRFSIAIEPELLASRWRAFLEDFVGKTHCGDRRAALRELHLQGHDFVTLRAKRAILDEIEVLENRLILRTRVVTREKVQRLFERRFGRRGERVLVRHLMINPARLFSEAVHAGKSPAEIDRQAMEQEARRQVEALAKRIRAGEDMEALARKYSHEVIAKDSGGLLERYDYDAYGEDFAKAVLATKVGALSAPFRSNAGWHVLRVEERTKTPFEKVAKELRKELEIQSPSPAERRDFIEFLESTHEIVLFPERLL